MAMKTEDIIKKTLHENFAAYMRLVGAFSTPAQCTAATHRENMKEAFGGTALKKAERRLALLDAQHVIGSMLTDRKTGDTGTRPASIVQRLIVPDSYKTSITKLFPLSAQQARHVAKKLAKTGFEVSDLDITGFKPKKTENKKHDRKTETRRRLGR